MDSITIGTRRSTLALRQTELVAAQLRQLSPSLKIHLKLITTWGDQTQVTGEALPAIGGKGIFTGELEEELLRGTIDIAVHSLKDLPVILPKPFTLGAICERASADDILYTRSGLTLAELPPGSVIGTSSIRRSSQILNVRPDLVIRPIRGNVETRIAKVYDSNCGYDATILAEAGIVRLGRMDAVTEKLQEDVMLPAPGQGALAIECLGGDGDLRELLSAIDHPPTRAEVTAEREFLHSLDAGCSMPIACRANCLNGRLFFKGRCLSPDGSEKIEVAGEGAVQAAAKLGSSMAAEILKRGYTRIMTTGREGQHE